MEYTGISNEKGEFVPRKHYEEFYRDGEIIEELYEFTDGSIGEKYNIPYGEYTLKVFNHAYNICWMFINGKGSVKEINHSIMFENDLVRNYSWAVAYALFRLQDKFYPLTGRTRMDFAMMLPEGFYRRNYADFMKGKSLSHPIDFRGSLPEPEPMEEEIDFAKAMDYMSAAMCTMAKAVKVQEENKELHKQLMAAHKESANDKSSIKNLQEQNALLIQKVNKLENDELCKVVNLETIAKYGLRQSNPTKVQVIVDMLNRLCVGKGCVPEPLRQKIEELEDHIIALESPRPVTQNNHGCQQFYGNVTDSDFHS